MLEKGDDTEDGRADQGRPDLGGQEPPVFTDRGKGPGPVLIDRQKAHEDKEDGEGIGDQGPPDKGCALFLLQDLSRHAGAQEDRHIEPPGIKVLVEGGKGGVQDRDHGHDGQHGQQVPGPAPLSQHPEGKDTGHGKAGQVEGQGSVADIFAGKEGPPGDQVRHDKEGPDDGERGRGIRIGHQVIAAQELRHAGIAHQASDRLDQEKCGQHQAGRSAGQDPEDLSACAEDPLPADQPDPSPDQVIQGQKDDLAKEKIVVDHRHEGRHQDEAVPAPPARTPFHKAVEGQQIQGEEGRHVMEVLKDDVAGLKA